MRTRIPCDPVVQNAISFSVSAVLIWRFKSKTDTHAPSKAKAAKARAKYVLPALDECADIRSAEKKECGG